jgi:hypothetical protein
VYDEKNLSKDGVNWHFEAGANVVYTGSATGGIFDCSSTGSNGPASFRVSGAGEFHRNGTGANADAVRIANASSRVLIEAHRIVSLRRAVVTLGGSVHANVATRIESTDGACDNAGGDMFVVADEVYSSGGFALEHDGGLFVARVRSVRSGGDSPAIVNAGGGPMVVYAEIIRSTADDPEAVILLEGGDSITVYGAKIVNDGDGYDALYVTLIDCEYDPARVSNIRRGQTDVQQVAGQVATATGAVDFDDLAGIDTKLGTPAGASLAADIAAVEAAAGGGGATEAKQDSISAKLDSLLAGPVNPPASFYDATSGNITIIAGDDYTGAGFPKIPILIPTTERVLTGNETVTAWFGFVGGTGNVSITCAIENEGASGQRVDIPMDHEDSAAIRALIAASPNDHCKFQLKIIPSENGNATQRSGRCYADGTLA